MTTKKRNLIIKFIIYLIAVILIVVSFFLPPQGIIDPSALLGSGLIIFGWEWMFGTKIKSFTIDSSGIHVETHDLEKN